MGNLQNKETNFVSREERGKRVRLERKRLGYTQQAIADLCGVHRVQWGRYERGEQGLDGEPLRKFGELGANIGYILTGQKLTSNAKLIGEVKPIENTFDKDETRLVSLFRDMTEAQRSSVLAMMESFVKN